jgi:AbrB family looped-hinge helix DNA binding protein
LVKNFAACSSEILRKGGAVSLDRRGQPKYDYRNSGTPDFRKAAPMELVKLGKKGQVSIPRSVLKRLGIESDAALLVDTTADGAIVLRPAAVYPIETYSDERIREFDEADRMDAATAARLARAVGKK